jgi:DNA-binding transcriptional MerR regulator
MLAGEGGMIDKAPDAYRTISEVGEELDLPQHVLRFWETRFSQIRPLKRGGGRRYYRPDDVELLKGIRHLLYSEGYTIKGVQRILKEHGPKAVQAFAGGLPPQGAAESTAAPDQDFADPFDDEDEPAAAAPMVAAASPPAPAREAVHHPEPATPPDLFAAIPPAAPISAPVVAAPAAARPMVSFTRGGLLKSQVVPAVPSAEMPPLPVRKRIVPVIEAPPSEEAAAPVLSEPEDVQPEMTLSEAGGGRFRPLWWN